MIISDQEYTDYRSFAHQFIDQNCIIRNTRLPGKMPGTTYTWMFYLRRALFNRECLECISMMFLYRMEREFNEDFNYQLSGLETAATPMLIGIPMVLSRFGVYLNSFVVRKEQKEYGLKNWIEGIPSDKPVLMIDDLCNSSASMRKCYNILTQLNIKAIPYAFTIVNKSNKAVHTEHRRNGDIYLPPEFKVISLFDLDDFNLRGPSH